jgi:hypothetical protein
MKRLPAFTLISLIFLVGCIPAVEPAKPAADPSAQEQEVSELGKDFVYGNGIGNAAVNVGTTLLFPPYALYVLGNAIISVSGYEGFYVSDLLPDPDREQYNSFYDTVTSGPGRMAAAMGGEEFRNREIVKESFTKIKKEILRPGNSS